MATTPAFASTPVAWSGLTPGTIDTNLTAPTNVTTLGTAGASGTKIEEIVCQGVNTTAAGVINVFLYDGTTYHLIDQFLVPVVTSSTTALAWRTSKAYSNLVLPANTWSLRVAQTVGVSTVKVTAFGASF